jgi:hypothetical protein
MRGEAVVAKLLDNSGSPQLQHRSMTSLTLGLSAMALMVSIVTAWLTLFRRGKLEMTKPSFIAFLYEREAPKVFFRALLYATGRRGHVVESMYIKLHRGELAQTFNYWAYGEMSALSVGSGIRVGEEGVVYNHHFLPPKDESIFQFLPGDYLIDVYGTLVHQCRPILLSKFKLSLSPEHCAAMKDKGAGIFYNWGPDSQSYRAHIDIKPNAIVMR